MPRGGVVDTLIANSASTSSAVYGAGVWVSPMAGARSDVVGSAALVSSADGFVSDKGLGSDGWIGSDWGVGSDVTGSRISSANVGRRGMVATSGTVWERASAVRSQGSSRRTDSLGSEPRCDIGESSRRRKSSDENRWLSEFGTSESSLGTPCYRPRLTIP